jgi:hypothetical protein
MIERRAQWKFLITDDGSWYWQVVRPGAKTRQSVERFGTLAECALAARHEGYVTCLDNPDRRDTEDGSTPLRVLVMHESSAGPADPADPANSR